MMANSIEVRDAKNPDRILGTIVGRPFGDLNLRDSFHVAVTPPISYWRPYDFDMGAISQITFRKHYRHFDEGYLARAEFRTDAPLDRLMAYPLFRLPGETADAAHHRQHSW